MNEIGGFSALLNFMHLPNLLDIERIGIHIKEKNCLQKEMERKEKRIHANTLKAMICFFKKKENVKFYIY